MSPTRGNRICELTLTEGTGAYVLAGEIPSYFPFSSACVVGNTCEYAVEAIDENGAATGAVEVALGTYGLGNTLSRTRIYTGSNGTHPVNWAAGVKRISLTVTAESLDDLPVSAQQAIPIINAATNLVHTLKIMAQMALRGQPA